MNKRVLWTLVLLLVVTLVLILNASGSISLDAGLFTISKASKAMVLLVFTIVGMVIGMLLR